MGYLGKMNLNEYFKGRRVLVTGHTGFKGAWLSMWLMEMGAEIIGLALDPTTNPNIFDACILKEKLMDIRGDITDYDLVEKVIAENKPEIIFHLAAQAIVKESYINPKKTFETNAIGTVNILEASRKIGDVKVIINVTTDKCYENKEWNYSYRENDRLGGHDPYSASKACSEIITSAYRKSFFPIETFGDEHKTLIATARAGNVIGGGDWSDFRLVPDCIRSLVSGETIVIRNPEAIRPWQYVLEPLLGYLMLCKNLLDGRTEFAEAWNFGPGVLSAINVEDMTKLMITTWGKGAYEVKRDTSHHEAKNLRLDTSKSETRLGWKQSLDVNEAVTETVRWYKTFYDGKQDMFDYSISCIRKYTG